MVLYLNLASIFASVFSLLWVLDPAAFGNLAAPTGGPSEMVMMLYFSLTTITTTGYGDIVPVDPFARSLANLESMFGQFYFAITVTRLVTLELEEHPTGTPPSRQIYALISIAYTESAEGSRSDADSQPAASLLAVAAVSAGAKSGSDALSISSASRS
ncbi:MAG TPA: ion channel [Steroidobacteraceae bacterium]